MASENLRGEDAREINALSEGKDLLTSNYMTLW